MKYKFLSKSNEWKDKLAGYHNWRITFVCTVCGYHITDTIQGTEERVKEYCSNPDNSICEECESVS